MNDDQIITINTDDIVEKDSVTPEVHDLFQLVHESDPILKEVMPEFDFDNSPVNPSDFASTLVETCKARHGLGLSANQCGFRYRVFVMGHGDEYVAFFNPKLISSKGEAHMPEGCLTFPFMMLRITRPETIEVEYQDYEGNKKTATYSGMSARCWLHELDHMNGIVYTSRAKPMALKSGMEKKAKLMKRISRIPRFN
jgi:peptide deformylase